jgi:hypothetical protein
MAPWIQSSRRFFLEKNRWGSAIGKSEKLYPEPRERTLE